MYSHKQGLEATGLKTKTIVHKSAAPIYAAAVTWVLYALLFPLYQVGHFLLAAAASAVVALIARMFCRDVTETVEVPEEPVLTGNVDLDKAIAEGDAAIKAMRALNDRIQDETISGQIDRLEEVSGKIFDHVKAHPEKLPQILFGDQAMDISTDITVLDNMMAREGLTGGDAVHQAAQENPVADPQPELDIRNAGDAQTQPPQAEDSVDAGNGITLEL